MHLTEYPSFISTWRILKLVDLRPYCIIPWTISVWRINWFTRISVHFVLTRRNTAMVFLCATSILWLSATNTWKAISAVGTCHTFTQYKHWKVAPKTASNEPQGYFCDPYRVNSLHALHNYRFWDTELGPDLSPREYFVLEIFRNFFEKYWYRMEKLILKLIV